MHFTFWLESFAKANARDRRMICGSMTVTDGSLINTLSFIVSLRYRCITKLKAWLTVTVNHLVLSLFTGLFLYFRSRTAFEKNKTDVFRIKTHNVGPIKKIRYMHTSAYIQELTTLKASLKSYSLWCTSCNAELSMITQAWVPAGSWTESLWLTWIGHTSASFTPATIGWAEKRQTDLLSDICWEA